MIYLLLHQPPPAASGTWTASLHYVDPLKECESNGDSDAEEFTEEKERGIWWLL